MTAVVGLATLISTIALWPGPVTTASELDVGERFDGRVQRVEACPEGDVVTTNAEGTTTTVPCDIVHVELIEGPDVGQLFALPPIYDQRGGFDIGETLTLNRIEIEETPFRYTFNDRQRLGTLTMVAVAFALSVVMLGRLRGLLALAGLGFSVVVLTVFTLPALLDGTNSLLVACVSSALIAFAALYLAHGFSITTTTAVLGTLASLAVTAGLGSLVISAARFSGFATEEAFFIDSAAGSVDVRGLLLAGLVIGALGALDDMTVTQASIVAELRSVDPELPRHRLFGSAMRIGRDHVASTVNTLFLAYAGASLPLLLLIVAGGLPLIDAANSEVIAIEIVRTLVGSIGLVISVPLTTWLAVVVLGAPVPYDPARHDSPDGPDDRPPLRRSEPSAPSTSWRHRLRAELDD